MYPSCAHATWGPTTPAPNPPKMANCAPVATAIGLRRMWLWGVNSSVQTRSTPRICACLQYPIFLLDTADEKGRCPGPSHFPHLFHKGAGLVRRAGAGPSAVKRCSAG